MSRSVQVTIMVCVHGNYWHKNKDMPADRTKFISDAVKRIRGRGEVLVGVMGGAITEEEFGSIPVTSEAIEVFDSLSSSK